MNKLDDLKRACQEKLAYKKCDLYGREQLRADMDYSFATTPDKILSLIASHEQLQKRFEEAVEVLEWYAKRDALFDDRASPAKSFLQKLECRTIQETKGE